MKYKKIRFHNLICLILILFTTSCSDGVETNTASSEKMQSQDSALEIIPVSPKTDTDINNIEGIQKAYEMISKQIKKGNFDSTTFKYNCNNEKSGEVSYFSQNGQLRMIVHRFNEYSHHSATDYYYVNDSLLFFVHNKRISWSFESGAAGATKDIITEQRVYLIDQKPIRCLEKKFEIRSQASDNPESELVPNRTVNCSTIKSVMKPFEMLLKYRYKATSGCL